MNIDEMKNKISMALKDPILQQGFEIICKENEELKEQLKTVKEMGCGNGFCPYRSEIGLSEVEK